MGTLAQLKGSMWLMMEKCSDQCWFQAKLDWGLYNVTRTWIVSLSVLLSFSCVDFMLRLEFQQNTGSSSSLQIFKIDFKLLSTLVPDILGKVFVHLIHRD